MPEPDEKMHIRHFRWPPLYIHFFIIDCVEEKCFLWPVCVTWWSPKLQYLVGLLWQKRIWKMYGYALEFNMSHQRYCKVLWKKKAEKNWCNHTQNFCNRLCIQETSEQFTRECRIGTCKMYFLFQDITCQNKVKIYLMILETTFTFQHFNNEPHMKKWFSFIVVTLGSGRLIH